MRSLSDTAHAWENPWLCEGVLTSERLFTLRRIYITAVLGWRDQALWTPCKFWQIKSITLWVIIIVTSPSDGCIECKHFSLIWSCSDAFLYYFIINPKDKYQKRLIAKSVKWQYCSNLPLQIPTPNPTPAPIYFLFYIFLTTQLNVFYFSLYMS